MTIVDSSTANTSLSIGDTMTSSGSTNTKGAWEEAIASTSEETYWLTLVLKGDVDDESFLVDIGVGAAASEVVKIANIPFFANSVAAGGVMTLLMPITVASGARVAVRCQATAGSQPLEYMVYLSNDSGFGTSTSNETLGADTSTSKGTDIDPGASDNTKGAYVQLSASTSVSADYVIAILGNSDNNNQTSQSFLVDVATGAAASEVDVVPNIPFHSHSGEHPSASYGFFQAIASSSRVSVRCQSSSTADAADRIIDATLLVFDITPPSGGGGIAQITGHGGIVG